MNRKKCYFVYFKNFHFKRKTASEMGHYVAVTSHTLVWAQHMAVTTGMFSETDKFKHPISKVLQCVPR